MKDPISRLSTIMFVHAGVLCGAVGAVHAQVAGVGFEFGGTVPDTLVWDAAIGDYVSQGNESFFVAGGLELLPFSASGMGGQFGEPGVGDFSASAGLSADAALDAGGVLSYGTTHSSFADFVFKPFLTVGSSAEVTFTVEAEASYELTVLSLFFDNDAGFASVVLAGGGLGTIVEFSNTFDPQPAIFSGTLAPGDYTLTSFASYGDVSLEFSVVPAPGVMGLMGLGGLFAARRRVRG